uniref:Solute carrier family 10 member 1 n=1 Tax=Monopterus albus TaxID=43700 RepID=A0A3Q3K1L3_MONAL|nr:sodium/bile acid cotransporter-like [Monopterus albus]
MNVSEVYNRMPSIYTEGNVSGNASMGFMRNSPLDSAISIFAIIILFITMMSLGSTMEISKIKAHLFKPKGPAIALVSQFCIMPLTAFCLAKILQMSPVKTLIVLVCGCCPGGNWSNIFSLAIEGDMNLSIVMTTCSNLAALGLMPLMLYLFSQGFPGLETAVPYSGIITALALSLLPCVIGIAINHYRPQYSPVIRNVGISILIISGIIVFILVGYNVRDKIWMVLKADILSASALMPLTGFMLGYVLSGICGLSPRCSRTISMETGCQNTQLCFAVLKMIPPQVTGPLILFPLLYYSFQCAEGLLLVLCFRWFRKFKAHEAVRVLNPTSPSH